MRDEDELATNETHQNVKLWVDGTPVEIVGDVTITADPAEPGTDPLEGFTGGAGTYAIRVPGLDVTAGALAELDRMLRRMLKRRLNQRGRLKMRTEGMPHRRYWSRLGSETRKLCRASTRRWWSRRGES